MLLLPRGTAERVLPGIYVGVVGALGASAATATVLARRRGSTLAHSLRPEAHALGSLQDDLLGRRPWPALSTLPHDGPVPTSPEEHGDPEGDLTQDPRVSAPGPAPRAADGAA
ncbi:hypothetical protein [Cellulomonas sp. Marseille-Q8402]